MPIPFLFKTEIMAKKYVVTLDTSVGFDKIYRLSECSQSELKKLYQFVPNLRNKNINEVENTQRKGNKHKSVTKTESKRADTN